MNTPLRLVELLWITEQDNTHRSRRRGNHSRTLCLLTEKEPLFCYEID
jgi:hypothetical protein